MSVASSGPSQDPLSTPIQFVKGVGPKFAETFAKVGIETVQDLLYCLPRRYEDRRNLPPIIKVRPGEYATIRGRIIGLDSRPTRGGKVILKASLSDGTGTVSLIWFNQPWVQRKLAAYQGEIIAYGLVKEDGWSLAISNPDFELLAEEEEGEDFARLVPVYPLTEGLRQGTIRKAAASAVEKYAPHAKEHLPNWVRQSMKLKPIGWCLRQAHLPDSPENPTEARRRLVFEEFLTLQLALEQIRQATHRDVGISFPISKLGQTLQTIAEGKKKPKDALYVSDEPSSHLFVKEHAAIQPGETLWDEVTRMFPFKLTGAQQRVIEEIWQDMESPHPMNRLVQGDVGAGKTAVAAASMLAAVRCGYQAAMMAPTEILAEQHYNSLRKLFEPHGIEVVLLVGKQSKGKKSETITKTKHKTAQIAVGTHALIQESVEFNRLGLVVIDEQHRFGVTQRGALRDKGAGIPDILVMTATPIPRTLSMTLYGHLDLSVLDELPPGRKPIKTHWKRLAAREVVYQQVRELIAQGRQAYFVCPMVAESEKMTAQAAEDLHYRLTHDVYPDLRVGLLHGQMKPKLKEEVMDQFRKNELDILVSTTVIEVGVDVPNASVMIIEDANRFGLAQLHQLRGRVGRGEHQSFCVLLADTNTEEGIARLDVMVATTDGFKIAEEDLRIRGPGDVFGTGTRQSGFVDFKVADLVQDSDLLEPARQIAQKLLADDPKMSSPDLAGLAAMVAERRSRILSVFSA